MSAPIYYGQAAYEGFAKAFGARLGVNIAVTGGANPCVDAHGTINLPGMDTFQTWEEFENTCATIIHEIAHVFYGSHVEFAVQQTRARLWRDCFNAVLDVADETGIGAHELASGNSRPDYLLVQYNAYSYKSNPALHDPDHPLPHWQVLAQGIIRTRLIGRKQVPDRLTVGAKLKARLQGQVDVAEAFRILRRARRKSRLPGDHKALIRLASKLANVLTPIAPSRNAPEPQEGFSLSNGGPPALRAGGDTLPAGCREATGTEGAAVVGMFFDDNDNDDRWEAEATVAACERTRDLLEPSVRRIAKWIATDNASILPISGFMTGTSVGAAYRLLTDGACMSRWQTNEYPSRITCAVLLDCSFSMWPIIREAAGVADAFARGLRACAEVRCFTFGGADAQECAGFAYVYAAGSTPTHLALQSASNWLRGCTGRRLIVCITDGAPDDPDQTRAVCQEVRDLGINMAAVALGESAEYLRASMPSATLAHARDVVRLAIELEVLGRSMGT